MWVEINGTSSTTINGLVITSIPPITMPPRKTNQILIDGRDGDIIEDLGAAAYDKTFTILLHNSYDPDAVIAFFAASGNVVFSNEPTKVYRYTQIMNTDIAKGNYNSIKVATITMHVQPYKLAYPAESTSWTTSSKTISNTGNATSAPRLRINGSGTVTVKIDGNNAFVVTMPSAGWVVIDSEKLDAYTDNNVLANRNITGAYEQLRLTPGSHTIARSGGTVSSMVLENYSRWI